MNVQPTLIIVRVLLLAQTLLVLSIVLALLVMLEVAYFVQVNSSNNQNEIVIILNIILDVNECTTNTDNCASVATCTNTIGSFNCTCPTGINGCIGKLYSIFLLFLCINIITNKAYCRPTTCTNSVCSNTTTGHCAPPALLVIQLLITIVKVLFSISYNLKKWSLIILTQILTNVVLKEMIVLLMLFATIISEVILVSANLVLLAMALHALVFPCFQSFKFY